MPISGLQTPLQGGAGREVVVTVPFADERAQPHRCGCQKNGYNMDTANVICRTPPAEWIADVLADELRAAGFRVVRADAPHRASALRIEGALLQLFVEPFAGTFSASCEADLSVRLVATSETGLRASRTFFAKGSWKGFSGVTGPFQVATERATQEALRAMVEAVIELMNRYPQLGMRAEAGSCVL